MRYALACFEILKDENRALPRLNSFLQAFKLSPAPVFIRHIIQVEQRCNLPVPTITQCPGHFGRSVINKPIKMPLIVFPGKVMGHLAEADYQLDQWHKQDNAPIANRDPGQQAIIYLHRFSVADRQADQSSHALHNQGDARIR